MALRATLLGLGRTAFSVSRLHWLVGRRLRAIGRWVVGLSELSALRHSFRAPEFNRPYYYSREKMYRWVVDRESLDRIDYLEFGVATGASFRWWLDAVAHPEARFFGFDVFTGLPEAWGRLPAGTFDQGGRTPEVRDARASFVSGVFQDTLPGFLARFERRGRLVVHVDADLYSSTLFVLATLAPSLRPGDILIFDELGSLSYPDHELRALQDFQSAFKVPLSPLASASHFQQVAFKVSEPILSRP